MITWNTNTVPESCGRDEECNPYYLVRLDGWSPVLAMYIEGEWWTNYTSKLMANVTGWTEI
jgi:hypothetical protein